MQALESAFGEFFSECDEILQRFSQGLSTVEKNPELHSETIDALYRDMHTLKGSAQLFGFQQVGQVAHAMEAALEPIRRLKIPIPVELIDSLFGCVDLIERILKSTSANQKELSDPFIDEVRTLVPRLLSQALNPFDGEFFLRRDTLAVSEGNHEVVNLSEQDNLRSKADGDISVMPLMQLVQAEQKSNSQKVTVMDSAETGSSQSSPKDESGGTSSGDTNSTVRIQVGLLDKLMNLVGEMVLVRNQVLQYSQRTDDLTFLNLSQRLDLVTSELQGEVMKTRMQPIGSILGKFQRVVRDLGKDLNKQIELSVQGADTELDKTLLEAIKDPLTHIIRNSCDHGVETSEERIKAGKGPVGHVRIRAYHEGGQVIIEVSDDGKGLNYKRILEKALEKKVVTSENAKNLSDREIGNLIFAPGFSTAEQVSAVSGRGVGMDVVKTNLEKVGGQVELQSEFQKGMTIRMRIPLTLAIVPALIVRVGSEQFAIPQIKLAELVRVENDGSGPKIEFLQGKPVFRLRGRLLSLVNLSEILKLQASTDGSKQNNHQADSVNIVVLNGEGDTFGLVVDEIKDTADIVVKPLSQFLKRLAVYSGATIMGDGTVSLILDITGIAQRANLFQKSKKELNSESGLSSKESFYNNEIQDFLFFRLNSTENYCLPLCLVNRLEEFSADQIELSGAQRIVKYRGSILPIISLNEILKLPSAPERNIKTEKVSTIVIQKTGRFFGVEVNEVVDILNVTGVIEAPVKETNGILGSVIVGEEVATVIDALGILDSVIGARGSSAKQEKNSNGSALDSIKQFNAKVLFAEDTVFFMKQVKKVLETHGMKVTHAVDGEEAWQMLSASKPGEYQLLLSDIEMPKVTGFELAEKVRSDSRFSALPLIALTTRFRDVDREKGKEVGFNYYLEKLKSDQLIDAIDDLLKDRGKK